MSLNVRPPPLKYSSLDRRMNRVVIALFAFMFSLIIGLVLSSFFFEQASSPEKWYLLNPVTGRTTDALWLIITRRFVAYFVLLSFIVPQSLMVMLDLCKAGQAAFIQWDDRMRGAVAKSLQVNDELGRVQFLFSDKTGTLTVNEMRFRRASAGGRFYESEEQLKAQVEREGMKGAACDMLLGIALCHDAIAVPAQNNKRHKSEKRLVPEQPTDVHDDDLDDEDGDQAQEEAEPQVSKSGLLHRSSSPDEEALLRAAARLSFELIENRPQEVTVKIGDRDVKMQKLATIPFSSARKRMSVIARLDNGRTRLICKGADSAVLPRLKGGSAHLNEMAEHVERMAVESGLRTLVLAARDLTQQQLDSWLQKWQEAQKLTDEEEKGRRSSELADEIEREMEPLGATGIEDRLQRGVPNTISALRAAGIRVWVITGDKPETAINIGYSCNLLHRSMTLCRVPMVASSAQDVSSALKEYFSRQRGSQIDTTPKALVISGEQITVAMHNAPNAFMEAILESSAVLACRVTPLQKAELVDFVRQKTGATTLSIGDGANDVPMLHAGNIGVGIFGREGTQAVSASDFAVRRFRDLKPLLFVHGRNALLRNSALIQFQIYKNMAFFLPQVWFALWCGFSSTTLYEPWIMTFFNLLFTSLPPLLVGLFERDLPRQLQETHPEIYPELRSNWIFGYWTLALWFLRGLFDSTLLYFFAILAWGDDGVALHGRAAGLAVLGNTIAVAAMLVVLGRMAFAIQTWTILLILGFVWSVLSFCGVLAIENWAIGWWPEQYGTLTQMLAPTPLFYITLAVAVCVCSEFIIPVIRRELRPDKRHVLLAASQAYAARGLGPFPSEDSRNALYP